jgi:hypothetical protein
LRGISVSGEHLLYPRLDRSTAEILLDERANMSPVELAGLAALEHPQAAPAPTGGRPCGVDRIEAVQRAVRQVAEATGFPHSLSTNGQQTFDRLCGQILYESMGIVPADAANEGVWSFLSLVVVPEVGPWRFPARARERLLGRPRNVLRRLWWRAWAFGPSPDHPDGNTPLGEDELVQIMERPSLGGNQRTARAIRDAIWSAELKGLSVARSEFVRELTLRVRAQRSHVALDALTDEELRELISEVSDIAETAATSR